MRRSDGTMTCKDLLPDCFKNVRSQMCREFLIDLKEKTQAITREAGLDGAIAREYYVPVPRWYPVPAQKAELQFDLYSFPGATPCSVNTNTAERPWIVEASNMSPFTYFVTMNTDAAAKKGLESGDRVEVESWRGLKVRGVLQVRKGQHRETLAIMGTSGRWAKGQPIAYCKAVNLNFLIELWFTDFDPTCAPLDHLVKVTKLA